MKVKPTDALSCMLNACVCSGTSGGGHRGGHCSMLVVLFSSITLQLIQEKAAGSTPLGFVFFLFCYFFGKLMECLFPLKENCLRMVPLFDHPQDNKAFPNVQFEPPLAQLCRKTADSS